MTSEQNWSRVRDRVRASSPYDESDRDRSDDAQPRERGARRQKLKGYLKAANELRQTYQQNYMQSWGNDVDKNDLVPGAFPGESRTATEELVIFPSYAIRTTRTPRDTRSRPASVVSTDSGDFPENGDRIKTQMDRQEQEKAVVEVDVRGWIYTPHSGALNRRTRIWVGMARSLAGLPAPLTTSPASSRPSSRSSSPHGFRERMAAKADESEEIAIEREAQELLRRGEAEAEKAGQGEYSERPGKDFDSESIQEERRPHHHHPRPFSQHLSPENEQQDPYDDSRITPLQKRASWKDTSQMSQEEIQIAHGHLMDRLKPFLATALPDIPISAFFYNDERSMSRTIYTNPSGHFAIRAPLDFVPTHVRVLAFEKLSATQEIKITEPSGVSVISDIDDTIKHSSIGSGAREIFRNVFIRDLADLSIDGVKDWYSKLAGMDVMFHYVSNSPWQLYPILTAFFAKSELPPGSFHLKQYSGVLQGIFEPVAERKKGTLEKLLRDFPERRFILVGDSGEADLEVYTDVVLENPGRILGVFIRDVTTTPKKEYFESARGSSSEDRPYVNNRLERLNGNSAGKSSPLRNMQDSDQSDHFSRRPALPSRPKTNPSAAEEENLIDLDWDETPSQAKSSENNQSQNGSGMNGIMRKPPPPPRPTKPSTSVDTSRASNPPLHEPTSKANGRPSNPTRASAPVGVTSRPLPATRPSHQSTSTETGREKRKEDYPPVPTSRKPISSYPAAAVQYASSLYNGTGSGPVSRSNTVSTSTSSSSSGSQASGTVTDGEISKKEEYWKRRWARAKTILDDKNVVLKSWRVGQDAMKESIALVERAQREARERSGRGDEVKERTRAQSMLSQVGERERRQY